MGFSLNRKSKLVIYGASAMAGEWSKSIREKEICVCAFLDRNAADIGRIEDVPVYTMEEWDGSGDEIVIILLQNAMQHREIAGKLYKKGVERIIFFPMRTGGLNTEKAFELRRIYNQCVRLAFDSEIREIPTVGELVQNTGKYESIIDRYGQDVILWCPIELCYSANGDSRKGIWQNDFTLEGQEKARKYLHDKNIYGLQPYWELFNYLYGEIDECPQYINVYGRQNRIHTNGYDDRELLENRCKLLKIYEEEICRENGISFFEDAPADAVVDEKGKVVIRDGWHRSIFLARRGYKWIPVRITAEEYQRYFGSRGVEELHDWLKGNKVECLEYPIEHPGFYGYPVLRQDVREIWRGITNEVGQNNLNMRAVADLSMTNGYFSRLFLREGADTVYCFLEKKDVLTVKVNELFKLDNMSYVRSTEEIENGLKGCDFVICSNKQLARWGVILKKWCAGTDKAVCVYDVLRRNVGDVNDLFGGKKIKIAKKYVVNGEVNELLFAY